MTLAGFRSRCRMPRSCAACSASAIWLASRTSFVSSHRTAERLALEILEDEVVGSDVVDQTNVWMVDRGDDARFTLKPAHILITLPLDDGSRETPLARPKETLEVELATHCLEGTWSCEVDLAGYSARFPQLADPLSLSSPQSYRRIGRRTITCRRGSP